MGYDRHTLSYLAGQNVEPSNGVSLFFNGEHFFFSLDSFFLPFPSVIFLLEGPGSFDSLIFVAFPFHIDSLHHFLRSSLPWILSHFFFLVFLRFFANFLSPSFPLISTSTSVLLLDPVAPFPSRVFGHLSHPIIRGPKTNESFFLLVSFSFLFV